MNIYVALLSEWKQFVTFKLNIYREKKRSLDILGKCKKKCWTLAWFLHPMSHLLECDTLEFIRISYQE